MTYDAPVSVGCAVTLKGSGTTFAAPVTVTPLSDTERCHAYVRFSEVSFEGDGSGTVIGLLVIGGMSASMVSINPVVAIGSGDNAIKLIDVINGIMPKVLSLLTTLGVYRLLKKGTKPNTILLGIIVVSVLLTAIGIF